MDNRVRFGLEDHLAHRLSIEQIDDDCLRSQRPYALAVGRRLGGADHLMTLVHQPPNEPGADRAARPCNENSHRILLLVRHMPDNR